MEPQRGAKPNRWVTPIGGKSTTKGGFCIIQSVGGTDLEWWVAPIGWRGKPPYGGSRIESRLPSKANPRFRVWDCRCTQRGNIGLKRRGKSDERECRIDHKPVAGRRLPSANHPSHKSDIATPPPAWTPLANCHRLAWTNCRIGLPRLVGRRGTAQGLS